MVQPCFTNLRGERGLSKVNKLKKNAKLKGFESITLGVVSDGLLTDMGVKEAWKHTNDGLKNNHIENTII